MIDRVLSDYVGTVVATQTISGREWWVYTAWCQRCGAELCRFEMRQTVWEDAINARSLVAHSVLKQIHEKACKCCFEYVPEFSANDRRTP